MVETHRQLAERSPGTNRWPVTRFENVNVRPKIVADPHAIFASTPLRRAFGPCHDDQPVGAQSAGSMSTRWLQTRG